MAKLDLLVTAGVAVPNPTGTGLSAGGLWAGMPSLEPGIQMGAFTALVALSAYAYYSISVPSIVPTSNNDTDPKVVKRRTERWSKEASVNPAFPSRGEQTNHGQEAVLTADTESSSTDCRGPEPSENSVNATKLEFNWQSNTDVSFNDIGGMTGLKNELRNEIIKPLEHPEKADSLGVSTPNILFHGPPGTGKTYTAKALATELQLPFVALSGADVQSKWINESASKVNNLFSEAREIAAQEGGAVVFIDELDSVLKSRSGNGNSHDEDNKVVNEFLNHLEETGDNNVVFIGATNRLDALDDAGIRSGRIDLKIHIGKPDAAAREAILHAQLADREHEISDESIAELAAATDGTVAADLERIVNEAAKHTLSRGGDTIYRSDID